ncbi:hypothetical protein P153DRAFT_263925, partial [Dothidotthia symphoricarpi CBS 119687]
GLESGFDESMRIKNTLDTIEATSREAPSWNTLALLVNCELRLWRLNENTPLRHNPFLTHWVDALLPWAASSAARGRAHATEPGITTEMMFLTRVGLIKAMLHRANRHEDSSEFCGTSPRDLYNAFVRTPTQVYLDSQPFDIAPFLRMLVEEGILEPEATPDGHETLPTPPSTAAPTPSETYGSPRLNDFQQWKQDILEKLQTAPVPTVLEITHLPLELSYLDFLTTLLVDHALEEKSIDPEPVITSYIQHSLRSIEQMGRPPGSGPVVQGSAGEVVDHGREAQSRAVKLLLLFVRNLIRKELVGAQVLYFEIQEICVRYVWIKEVREFKRWV